MFDSLQISLRNFLFSLTRLELIPKQFELPNQSLVLDSTFRLELRNRRLELRHLLVRKVTLLWLK